MNNKYERLYSTPEEALGDTELVAPFFGFIESTKDKIYMSQKFPKDTELAIGPDGSGYIASKKSDYLTVECVEPGGISLTVWQASEAEIDDLDLWYKKNDEEWVNWKTINFTNIDLSSGDILKLKGSNPGGFSMYDPEMGFTVRSCVFVINTGKMRLHGNIMSLIDGRPNGTVTIPGYSYWGCFYSLFHDCTSLVTAPELPATNLFYYCYSNMFSGCTGLTEAPELPATTLMENCYAGMFIECTGLQTINLPASSLVRGCYTYMFYGCESLSNITVNFSNWEDDLTTGDWVYGVNSTGTFKKPAELEEKRGSYYIPDGWTIQDK